MSIEETIRKIIAEELDKKIQPLFALLQSLNIEEDELYGTATKAAKRYGVSEFSIRNWSKKGYFKKYPTKSGTVLYNYEEIEAHINPIHPKR